MVWVRVTVRACVRSCMAACVWRRFCVCICVFLYLSVCARYGLTDLSILLSFLRISVLHVDFDDFCAYVNVCASSFLSVCLCAMRYGYILRQPDAMPFQRCWLYLLSASWAAACVSCSFSMSRSFLSIRRVASLRDSGCVVQNVWLVWTRTCFNIFVASLDPFSHFHFSIVWLQAVWLLFFLEF